MIRIWFFGIRSQITSFSSRAGARSFSSHGSFPRVSADLLNKQDSGDRRKVAGWMRRSSGNRVDVILQVVAEQHWNACPGTYPPILASPVVVAS